MLVCCFYLHILKMLESIDHDRNCGQDVLRSLDNILTKTKSMIERNSLRQLKSAVHYPKGYKGCEHGLVVRS